MARRKRSKSSLKQQVKTTRQNQGPEFYKEIGSIGGNNSPTKYTSDTGRQAAIKRWTTYRENQLNKLKELNNE